MAHIAQREFCQSVQRRFPTWFAHGSVLDCGSLDLNGNNRYLFTGGTYLGLDVAHGKNVDIVSPIHKFNARDGMFDFIVSTECFEHDMYWKESFANMYRMLRDGGMLMFTCAAPGRPEHGTLRSEPESAPLLAACGEEWANYYRNLSDEDYRGAFDIVSGFSQFEFRLNNVAKDLYFWGIKRDGGVLTARE